MQSAVHKPLAGLVLGDFGEPRGGTDPYQGAGSPPVLYVTGDDLPVGTVCWIEPGVAAAGDHTKDLQTPLNDKQL